VSVIEDSLREFKQSQLRKAGTKILKNAPFLRHEVEAMLMVTVV